MENLTGGPVDDDQPALPTKNDEEFRPFIRRLPEFKFWYWSTRAIVFSLLASTTRLTDIPVFWPILLIVWTGLNYLLWSISDDFSTSSSCSV